jgi:hypothetical protein
MEHLLGSGCVIEQLARFRPLVNLSHPVCQIRIVELNVEKFTFVLVRRAVRRTNRVVNFLVEPIDKQVRIRLLGERSNNLQFEGLFVFGAVVGAAGRVGLRGRALVAGVVVGGLAAHTFRAVLANGGEVAGRSQVRDF